MTPTGVLIIIGGGVSAYKALELIRLLRRDGVAVRAVLTPAGARFVTPLSVGALTGGKVFEDLFSLSDEAEMGHIELSRSAELLLVAPATADLMAKAAQGRADDLASTVLLATDKPVMMAPAMNVRMWLHPATQRNVERLIADGVELCGPDVGDMACGETGPGRMAEPAAIAAAVKRRLGGTPKPLKGRRVLVTAGPTLEAIDPVRFLSNRSSGRQGYEIAAALEDLGAEVVLVSGPVALEAPPRVRRVWVESAADMLAACDAALPVDAAVMVAAVADYRPSEVAGQKLKKTGAAPEPLSLVENPDILAALSKAGPRRPRLVVGFAAETQSLEAEAKRKLERKGCDVIVANDVSSEGVMGGAENEVLIVRKSGVEAWPRMSKARVARRLAEEIALALGAAS